LFSPLSLSSFPLDILLPLESALRLTNTPEDESNPDWSANY
jgi:hypothetical protein